MSRHFELMQQTDKAKDSHRDSEHISATEGADANKRSQVGSYDDEALRLVQQIFLLHGPTSPRVVVFAGVDHGSGCSRICASVAETLAQTTRRSVCLVEGNFRSPSLSGLFGTTNHYGFADALTGEDAITTFAKPLAQAHLWLLPSGPLGANAAGLITSEVLKTRFLELREAFDFVIVDAPPLKLYSEATVLGQLTDGIVLVLEAGSTRREAAVVAVSSLRSSDVPVLAAVLNKRTLPIPEKLYRRI